MRVLFIVNPRSGVRRQRDMRELIAAACSYPFEIASCEKKDDLDAIISAARDRFDLVCAVGGDGTVHEVAKRLIGTQLPLAIVPSGSGNGFARHLGLPMRPEAAAALIASGRIATIDTAEANGEPFIGVMGTGFDALVAHRFASSEVRGLRTYVREILLGYSAFGVEEYAITVDGETLTRKAMLVAVANSSQYGNNARVAPLASLCDGLLDVVIIKDIPLVRAPLAVARLFQGTFDRTAGVEIVRGREITIRCSKETLTHVDGEPFAAPREIEVRIRPASLRVVVPSDNERI